MAWNGVGQYVLNPLFYPEVNGNVIDAVRYDGLFADVAAGVSFCLAKNGENVPTANLRMGGYKHTGAGDASATGQYLTYGQSAAVLTSLTVTTLTGTTFSSTNATITNLTVTGTATLPSVTVGSAAVLNPGRNIDGVLFTGAADITVVAPATHAATSKVTPVDADELPVSDSAASFVLKKVTWANLKATLKAYFDTLYLGIAANAASATKLVTARNINGVAFDGTTNITVTAVATSGTATTAATLATPRALNGVNFDGSAAVLVPSPTYVVNLVGAAASNFTSAFTLFNNWTATAINAQSFASWNAGSNLIDISANGVYKVHIIARIVTNGPWPNNQGGDIALYGAFCNNFYGTDVSTASNSLTRSYHSRVGADSAGTTAGVATQTYSFGDFPTTQWEDNYIVVVGGGSGTIPPKVYAQAYSSTTLPTNLAYSMTVSVTKLS